MKSQIIQQLDEFVCEQYENVQQLSTLSGYVMPSAVEVAESELGPVGRLKLNRQPNPEAVLQSLKQSKTDVEAGFTYAIPLKTERARDFFHPKKSSAYIIRKMLKKYGRALDWPTLLDMPVAAWKKITQGEFYPTKRTCLRFCILLGATVQEYAILINAQAKEFDRENLWEVIGVYLLFANVSDRALIDECFAEYGMSLIREKDLTKNEFFDD